MSDTAPSDDASSVIARYQRNVARALLDYVTAGNLHRLRGDRDGDRLILTFVLDDADEFHSHLARHNRAEK